ncbi:MAG: phage-related protein [Planctomycetota bacterium]|jgi:phage-related protein
MGDSYNVLCVFPTQARQDAGFQLNSVQHGLAPTDWKSIPSIGSGVQEIRIGKGGAFRVIYIAKYDEAVYVLHVFQKKTQRTPKKNIDLAKQRLRDVQHMRREK